MIVVPNIGSLFIVEQVLNRAPWIVLLILSIPAVMIFIGIITGIFAIYKLMTGKPDIFLSIGTSDGKRLNIVSKDRNFLESVLKALREKIDADRPELIVGEINIDKRTATINSGGGGISIGASSQAMGRA